MSKFPNYFSEKYRHLRHQDNENFIDSLTSRIKINLDELVHLAFVQNVHHSKKNSVNSDQPNKQNLSQINQENGHQKTESENLHHFDY